MKKTFLLTLVAIICIGINICDACGQNKIEKAVAWAIEIAKDNTHGYSQGAENATKNHPYTGSREGPDYDCSALVYHALDHAGFDIIAAWRKNPSFMKLYNGKQETGDSDTIWTDLKVIGGFAKYNWNDVKNCLKRGDILCDPKHHVAIYIGNGKTVEARGVNNPKGGDWRTGDQGGEIDIYSAYGRSWKEVYRYVGK
ncbi:MAG: C40 family peptidase [Selenomonadaceae bacterium]|nr:C40 family peptidase [Selenomonadaceae bacterium]